MVDILTKNSNDNNKSSSNSKRSKNHSTMTVTGFNGSHVLLRLLAMCRAVISEPTMHQIDNKVVGCGSTEFIGVS